jgi:hypothetical protein
MKDPGIATLITHCIAFQNDAKSPAACRLSKGFSKA